MATQETANKDVERRRSAAYWYAVGHADGTGEEDRSDEFAKFAAEQATAYHVDHTTTFLASIIDQWRQFTEEPHA